MQDHASNSSHSSRRGSAQTSTGEERPVNPVVSFSPCWNHSFQRLSKPVLHQNECKDVSVRDSQVYSSFPPAVWKSGNRFSEVLCWYCVTPWAWGFQYWSLFSIFMSFNSYFQSHLGCLQAGRRSETLKEDVTMSTTTADPLHGHDPSFRYKVGFLIDVDRRQNYVYWHTLYTVSWS